MIKVLDKPHLDLTTPIGRGFIAFLSALAEDERQRIVKRANDGRAAARKRGVHLGRKPKLTELQRRVARERIAKGESARSIAQEWGVAHTTVARAVAQDVSWSRTHEWRKWTEGEGMEITFLGTGSPMSPERCATGLLVTAPGCEPLLIDTCGGFELPRQLARIGQPIGGLRNVIVTHKHMDHMGGMPALFIATIPLKIYASADTHAGIRDFMQWTRTSMPCTSLT